MRVMGLDLSLTSTGYSIPVRTSRIVTKPDGKDGIERCEDIARHVTSACLSGAIDVVFVEGYAYGRAEQAHALGQLGGIVRHALNDIGCRYVNVPPARVKKFATGKGNANKDAMLAAAIRVFGYEGASNDEADAWLLRILGECVVGEREAPTKAAREVIEAMNKEEA